jgi:hypothetical protein
MSYQIIQLPKVAPKYIFVHGATSPEQRLNPGPILPRPAGTLIYKDHTDLYGDDPTRRVELWQTDTGTATNDEILAACPRILDHKIEALWSAAHDYEYEQISGSAIGLLVLGVMQGKPKCSAVQAWIKAIWTEYYTRKAAVRIDTEPDLDFTPCGQIPHTVPELMAEVGV